MVVNVTQAPYNCDNTGVAPCLTALTSAIAALAASSDDTNSLYFPTGTYLIENSGNGLGLNINTSGVTLYGDGSSNSILVGHGNADASHGVGPLFLGGADTLHNVAIQDLGLESNSTAIYSGLWGLGLIYLAADTNGCAIRRCSFSTRNLCGLANNGFASGLLIEDCTFSLVGEHGIYIASRSEDLVCRWNTLLGVASDALGAVQTAISVKNSTRAQFYRNDISGNWRNSAFNPADFDNIDLLFRDNAIHDMTYDGVVGVNCNYATIGTYAHNYFVDINHSGIIFTGTYPIESITLFRNYFIRVGGVGRAVTIQSSVYRPTDIKLIGNRAIDCTQGYELDGCDGVDLHDNWATRSPETANPGYYLLNAGQGAWAMSNNRSLGYTGNSIAAQVEQTGNLFE